MCDEGRGCRAANGVEHRPTVRHAVVGVAISVYGSEESQSSAVIDPADLPRCDVLELDCEGAEITILENMRIAPRSVLVETHGLHGATTGRVHKLLEDRNYDVVDLGWAEPRMVDDCKEHDIRILAGTLRPVPRSTLVGEPLA
jgi:Methyltransferase FkbM domain